ncbi:hypothetical protein OROGR_005990 [Orobanche gracilis]
MREGELGNQSEEMENDDSELGFEADFHNVCGDGEDEELGPPESDQNAIGRDKNESFGLDSNGKSNEVFQWVTDLRSRFAASGGSGSQGVKVDVNLNLGLVGEPSSSTSSVRRENCDRDTQNKRPKVHSFSLDWSRNLENETHYLAHLHEVVDDEDVPDSNVAGDNARSNDTPAIDDSEVRMDLTGDMLHMVFSFLDHIDLCRAARVCRHWRDASSHEDFWRYLNFENRYVSPQQFEDMCQRYPNATAVNIYGTPAIHPVMMKAISSLRNLEVFTLGKGQLGETFFQAVTDCHMLKSLTVNDASLGNGVQDVLIQHDRLHDLQIMKCRVFRVSIRCPQLETLSLKRSSMPHAVLNCPLLRELDIASCHKLTDAAIRTAATSCPLLESLDLSNCSCVSDETLREIAMACGNLHILDASYCPNISLESVRLPMLTVLKLHSCEGITSASMLAIAYSDMLEVLELDNCSLLTAVALDLPRLKNIRLVHCRKFVDFNLRSSVLSSITVSNCPYLRRISITSNVLKKLVLQKQESLTTLELQCDCLQEVDLTECESLTNSICEVFSDGGGCPVLRSLVLDSCESLTTASFSSTSLVSLSLGGCRAITSVELKCPHLEHVSLDGCDHLERASFSPVGIKFLNMGQLKDDCLSATTISVLKLQACKYLCDTSLEPLYKGDALPALSELDLSYGTLPQSAIEELLAGCMQLTHVSLNGCVNMHDLNWESHRGRLSETRTFYEHMDQRNRLLQNLNCVGCPNIKKVVIPPMARCIHLSSLNLSLSSNLKEVDISCCTLFFLNLSNCNSLEILKLDCPRLTSLFLQSCNIDEVAVESATMHCNMLETLDVRFCPKIFPSSMNTLRGACPSLKRIFSSLIPA